MPPPENRAPSSAASDRGPSNEVEESTVLVIGEGEPLLDALRGALERHRISMEQVSGATASEAAIAIAPDAVLLVGDAAKDGGVDVLKRFTRSPLAAVLPVLLLSEGTELAQRVEAFRFGVTAVVPRTASVDAIAARVAELVSEIPERTGHEIGHVGEATLDQFVHMLARELRTGILSVKDTRGGEGKTVRLVLGEGKSLARVIEEFVTRVRPLVEQADVLKYEFQEHLGGTLQWLRARGQDTDRGMEASVESVRVLLADDDAARADAIAQGLRVHGATVVITDLRGKRLERARLLDPMVLVISETELDDAGFELVQAMQADRRLRWAYLLLVRWEELWGEGETDPSMERLFGPISKLATPDRNLRQRGDSGEVFDTRLEVVGPGRLLRSLAGCAGPLRATVQNRRGTVQIELMEGLVVGALHTSLGRRREGIEALTTLLGMASGRVRIEPTSKPAFANVMTTVDMALNLADAEKAPVPPSTPPETVLAGAGEKARHVASAKSIAPQPGAPARAKRSREPTLVGWSAPPPTAVSAGVPTADASNGPTPAPKPQEESKAPTGTSATKLPAQTRSVPSPRKPSTQNMPAVKAPSSPKMPAVKAPSSQNIPSAKAPSIPSPRKPSTQSLPAAKTPSMQNVPAAKTPSMAKMPAVKAPSMQNVPAAKTPSMQNVPAAKAPSIPTPRKPSTQSLPAAKAPSTQSLPAAKAPVVPAAVAELGATAPAHEAAPTPTDKPETGVRERPDAKPSQEKVETGIRDRPEEASAPITSSHSVVNLESVPDLSLPAITENATASKTDVSARIDLPVVPPSMVAGRWESMPPEALSSFAEATQPDATGPVALEVTQPDAQAPILVPPESKPPSQVSARSRRTKLVAAAVVACVLVVWAFVAMSGSDDAGPEQPLTTEAPRAATTLPLPAPVAPVAPTARPEEAPRPTEPDPNRVTKTVSKSVIPAIPAKVARMTPADRRIRSRRLRELGLTRFRRRQFVLAAAAWRSAWIYQPSRAQTALNVARAFFRLGRHDEALAWALKATELEPNEAGHFVVLGDVYEALNDRPAAERAWREALAKEPRNRAARRRVGALASP